MFVAVLVRVTDAPWTIAPLGSVTVPCTTALYCAWHGSQMQNRAATITHRIIDIVLADILVLPEATETQPGFLCVHRWNNSTTGLQVPEILRDRIVVKKILYDSNSISKNVANWNLGSVILDYMLNQFRFSQHF